MSALIRPDTSLRGRWLTLVRVAWVVVALLTIILFVANIPFSVARLQTVCVGAECPEPSLRPDNLQELPTLGLSVAVFATYFTVVNIIFALIWFAVGALIFWRASNDRMALLSALMLVTFGGTFASDQRELANAYPAWWLPVTSIGFLAFACLLLFLYLFPAGDLCRAGRAGQRWCGLRMLCSTRSSLTRHSIPTTGPRCLGFPSFWR
jgi:hypothetical protein